MLAEMPYQTRAQFNSGLKPLQRSAGKWPDSGVEDHFQPAVVFAREFANLQFPRMRRSFPIHVADRIGREHISDAVKIVSKAALKCLQFASDHREQIVKVLRRFNGGINAELP